MLSCPMAPLKATNKSLRRKQKGMTRSQSEPPRFDIWDVQRYHISEG